VNTSAKKLYFATGATASTDWTIANWGVKWLKQL
jgi:hypothetical protein